jgi:hypothetical protein
VKSFSSWIVARSESIAMSGLRSSAQPHACRHPGEMTDTLESRCGGSRDGPPNVGLYSGADPTVTSFLDKMAIPACARSGALVPASNRLPKNPTLRLAANA